MLRTGLSQNILYSTGVRHPAFRPAVGNRICLRVQSALSNLLCLESSSGLPLSVVDILSIIFHFRIPNSVQYTARITFTDAIDQWCAKCFCRFERAETNRSSQFPPTPQEKDDPNKRDQYCNESTSQVTVIRAED